MVTVLNLDAIVMLTRRQFYRLCLANPDVSMERSLQGELIIMTPVRGEGGREVDVVAMPTVLLGENVMSGFSLEID